MLFKLFHFVDKKHFGDQVLVYKGNSKDQNIYFVIMKDREEIVYSIVDDNTKRLYPMDTYIHRKGIHVNLDNIPDSINTELELDLSKYGYSDCPKFLSELIKHHAKIN